MIARKDALIKYGVFPSNRARQSVAAAEHIDSGRDSAGKHKAGRNTNQFNGVQKIPKQMDAKRVRRKHNAPCTPAKRSRYFIENFCSKLVIYLPPFPIGSGGNQGHTIGYAALMPPFLCCVSPPLFRFHYRGSF